MNKDAKILNKIPANHIQHHIMKEAYIMTKWDLPLECKDASTYKNQLVSH